MEAILKIPDKPIKEINFSQEKQSLTIYFKDGTSKGYSGPIALQLSKQLKTYFTQIENGTN